MPIVPDRQTNPQALAVEIVADGLSILRTRDAVGLTDEQIVERARNIVTGLMGCFELVPVWAADVAAFRRSVRAFRCGELLAAIMPAKGAATPKEERRAGSGPALSRAEAAREAGLSKRQKDTALRVAALPAETFEEKIESGKPATVTELAEPRARRVRSFGSPPPVVDEGSKFAAPMAAYQAHRAQFDEADRQLGESLKRFESTASATRSVR
jgi:hypothetical protein